MRRAISAALLALPLAAAAQSDPGLRGGDGSAELLDIYRSMVETRTVHPDGDNTAVARAVARRLLEAGYDPKDVEVIEPRPLKGNLLARLRGTGELEPILLLAHIDVVEARKEDWSDGLDPFKLTERDGYYYGRGTIDDKAMASIFTETMLRLKREGFVPKRDVILALTADEETGGSNGVEWLLHNRRADIDAAFALNEGGGGAYRHGKPWLQSVQVSEKMYLSFDFDAANAGGHSSVPRRDNAIYDLAAALDRLSRHDFPVRYSAVTRAYFRQLSQVETGAVAEAAAAIAEGNPTDAQLALVSRGPRSNAELRTTCVATRLEGGHADNALPQRAHATVNCRLMPGEDPQLVAAELQRIAGERVSVKARGKVRVSEPSDPAAPIMGTIRRVSQSMWPGVPVVPAMGTGATDGSRLRNAGIPVYGVSGLFVEFGETRSHGRDERLGVEALRQGNEFLHRLVRALARGE
jgi:acetylornithine deacetylase/succinyl-diaminopimelate desuccinylase-like protein